MRQIPATLLFLPAFAAPFFAQPVMTAAASGEPCTCTFGSEPAFVSVACRFEGWGMLAACVATAALGAAVLAYLIHDLVRERRETAR